MSDFTTDLIADLRANHGQATSGPSSADRWSS